MHNNKHTMAKKDWVLLVLIFLWCQA
jgi:hypothetical protein